MSPNKPPLSSRERKLGIAMFCLCVLFYCFINFQRVAVPGQLFDDLQRAIGCNASAIAALGTSFMYTYAIGCLLVGPFVDKFGGLRVFAAGAVLMTIGALLFPFVKSYWMLLACRILIGLGCAGGYLSLVKEVDHLFPQKFALVVSILLLTGYLGSVAATAPLAQASHIFGWRKSMLFAGLLTLVSLLGIASLWYFIPKTPVRNVTINLASFRSVFTNYWTLLGASVGCINFGLYYIILTVISGKFLCDIAQLSRLQAATISGILVVIPSICGQVMGILSTLTGNRRRVFYLATSIVPSLAIVTILISMATGPFAGRGILLAGCILCFGIGGSLTPIGAAFTRETNPPEHIGTALGIINLYSYTIIGVLGTVSGLVLDQFPVTYGQSGVRIYPTEAYAALFAILLALQLLALRNAFLIPETHGQNIYTGKPYKRFWLSLHK
ncbi:MAG: MFS transporter [Victivallales bacterium]|nr:MFS transporter [Victivallales bacterium]